MIIAIQSYFETIYPDITFGQIQDTSDNLINMNIYDTGSNPFFGDTKTHILTINLFIRNTSFEVMEEKMEIIGKELLDTYDKDYSNCHIVNTTKKGSDRPNRDEKNRYSISSTYEMLIEEV